MTTRIDSGLRKDLGLFGLRDAAKCYDCGTCSAVCPLSEDGNVFPRKIVRYVQMGLEDKILKSADPWLCYYCGDCSDRCPRGADPGEAMMVARRYLTSRYDWTGFSRRFYISETFEIVSVAVVALLTGLAMFLLAQEFNLETTSINAAWPVLGVEIFDLVLLFGLSALLLSNVVRCVKFQMGDQLGKIPIGTYLAEAKSLIVHFLTQKQFSKCSDRKLWVVHLLIMGGYVAIFTLVVVFLAGGIKALGLYNENLAFQRDVIYPLLHPIKLIGYIATAAILAGVGYALIGRMKKSSAPYKHSHASDWMFLVLLLLVTLTGIVMHIGRQFDWPAFTYGMYIFHMMVTVPMLVLEVPFAKWSHLAYRPVTIFLVKVKERYAQQAGTVKEAQVQAS